MNLKIIQIKNRFTALLLSLVFLFFVSPFLSRFNFPALSILLFLIVIFTLRALKIQRPYFILCALLALCGILFETLVLLNHVSPNNLVLSVVMQSFYILFLGISTVILVVRIFSEKSVTADTIGGGISVYLLTGLLWAFMFNLIATIDPHAFTMIVPEKSIKDLLL